MARFSVLSLLVVAATGFRSSPGEFREDLSQELPRPFEKEPWTSDAENSAAAAAAAAVPKARPNRLNWQHTGEVPEDKLQELSWPSAKETWSSDAKVAAAAAALLVGGIVVFVPDVASAAESTITVGAVSLSGILEKASSKALGEGVAGAAAMVSQVFGFMWLRTVMNYQYTTPGCGGTFEVAKKLYQEGGIGRLYRGVGWALLQSPASRFGDTAANAGILALFEAANSASGDSTALAFLATLPLPIQTGVASVCAALWRITIFPLDTMKTLAQVQGEDAKRVLQEKLKARGVWSLWDGAGAVCAATFVGHYPFFLTYNALDAAIPIPHESAFVPVALMVLGRRAFIGFVSSCTSDTCSNGLRVLKTAKQAGGADPDQGYIALAKDIISKDGVKGLLGRGLKTRLLVNGLQGAFFSVIWKFLEKQISER